MSREWSNDGGAFWCEMRGQATVIYVFALILVGSLTALTVIDIRSFRLPDVLTLPLLIVGLMYGYLLADIWAAILGAVLGYGIFVAVEIGFKRLRGIDGLGRGDAKLLAAGGAWCGWMAIPHIVLISSILGIAYVVGLKALGRDVDAQTAIPFGPFLAFGIAVVWALNAFYIPRL